MSDSSISVSLMLNQWFVEMMVKVVTCLNTRSRATEFLEQLEMALFWELSAILHE
jgi:hypothetical protein